VKTPPDFEAYINQFAADAAAKHDIDPTLVAIKGLLLKYIQDGEPNPRGKNWKLNVVDGNIEIESSLIPPDYTQREPLPEREALILLVTRARLEREAAQRDGRGPWTSGVLYILESGHTFISGDWC
jgi:hypothetical protein